MSSDPSRKPDIEVNVKVGDEIVKLDQEAVRQVARNARRRGNYAGVATGALAGYGGWRYLRFSRNKALLAGALTCVFSGYAYGVVSFVSQIQEMAMARRVAQSSELIPDELLQDPAEQWKTS